MRTEKQIQNLKPFKKGADPRRNIKGQPRKLPALEIIVAEVLGEETDGISAAQQILKALRLKAKKGDVRAAELLLDRAYGKLKQQVNVNTNLHLSDQPITFE